MARYIANDKYNSTLTSGWTASPADTTLSVGSVPASVPTIVVAAKGTSNETVFSVVGTSGSTLTGVLRLRGANVNLAQGTSIEILNSSEFINQYQNAVFDQAGLKVIYGSDAGSSDAYAITLSPAVTSYTDVLGVPIAFRANTVNTGAATLALNGLTAKTIKKRFNQDLSDGDIVSGQVVYVIYDGTNFQALSSLAQVVNTVDVQTLTNKRVTKRTGTTTSSATPTINTNNIDFYSLTAQTADITSFTTNLSGTPTEAQTLWIAITGTATRAITWGTSFESSTVTLPTTTVTTARLDVGFVWNTVTSKWRCVASI